METLSRMPLGLRMFFTTKYRSDLMTKMIIEGPADLSEHSLQGWFVRWLTATAPGERSS